MKNIPSVFDQEEVESLAQFLNVFLKQLEEQKLKFTTMEDFQVLSNIVGLVAYLSKNEFIGSNLEVERWRDFIRGHRLPEVRMYSDVICL